MSRSACAHIQRVVLSILAGACARSLALTLSLGGCGIGQLPFLVGWPCFLA